MVCLPEVSSCVLFQDCQLIVARRYPYTVNGKPWFNSLKDEDYKDEIVEFKQILAAIGEDHGWKLEDLKARFSNDLFDELIFEDVVVPKEEKPTTNGHTNGL